MPDPKDPKNPNDPKGKLPMQFVGGDDGDDWASAIDEWDAKLDLPEVPPLSSAPKPDAIVPVVPLVMKPAPVVDESAELTAIEPMGFEPGSLDPAPLAPAPQAGNDAATDSLNQLFGDEMALPSVAASPVALAPAVAKPSAPVQAPLYEEPSSDDVPDEVEVVDVVEPVGVEGMPSDFGDITTPVGTAADEFDALLSELDDKPAETAKKVEPPKPEAPKVEAKPAEPPKPAATEPAKTAAPKVVEIPKVVEPPKATAPSYSDDDDDMPEISTSYDSDDGMFSDEATRVAAVSEIDLVTSRQPTRTQESAQKAAAAAAAAAAIAPILDDDFYDTISIEASAAKEEVSAKRVPVTAPPPVEEQDPLFLDAPLPTPPRDRSSDPDLTPLPVGTDDEIFGVAVVLAGVRPSTPLVPRRIELGVELSAPQLTRTDVKVGTADQASLQSLLSLYDTERILSTDAARSSRLASYAAQLSEELGDSSGAIERWESALEQDATQVVALRGLRRALCASGQLDRALTLIDRESERSSEAEQGYLAALAAELHVLSGDRDLAREAYQRRGTELRARTGLVDLAAAEEGGHEALGEAVGALLEATPAGSPLRAALLIERARLDEVGGKLRDAVARYREALATDPRSLGAVFGLLRIAVRTPGEADDIEPHLKLAEVLPRGPLRAAVERRVAVLKIRAGDSANARPLLGQLDDNPLCVTTAVELERADGRAEEASALLGRSVALEADPGRRAGLLVELGRLEEERGATGAATAAYRRAAVEYADDPRAARALERTALLGGDKTQALERHLAIAARSPDDAATAALEWTHAARLLEELGRRPEAEERLAAALNSLPGYPPAVALAVELRLADGKSAEAARVLAWAAEHQEDTAVVSATRSRAARLYARAGELNSANTVLAPLLADGPPWARWLDQRLRTQANDAAGLASSLKLEAESAEVGDRARAVSLWHEAGLVLGTIDPNEALECLRRVLTIDPTHGPATMELVAMLLVRGPADEIPALLDARLAAVEPRPESAREELRLALSLMADRGDFSAARAGLERAQRARPDQPVFAETLARLGRRVSDDGLVAQALLDEAAVSPPDARFALFVAAAERGERLGQFDRAAERWQKAVELRPQHPIAQMGLERAYIGGRNFAALADLALQRLKEATDADTKVRAYEHLAYIDGELRGDHESALFAYQSILETDHSHHVAVRTLERVYLRDGRWAELVALYDMLGLVASVPDFAAAVHLDRARLRRRAAAASDGAVTASDVEAAFDNDYRLALFKASHHRPALRHLIKRARLTDDLAQRADLAVRLGESVGTDVVAAAVFFTRAAEALAALGRVDEARARFQIAVDRRPNHLPALLSLLDLGLVRGEWNVAVNAAERAGKTVANPAARARMLLIAGALAEDHIADPTRARVSLDAAFDIEPRSMEAFDRLRRVLTTLGDWAALAELYRRRLGVETDGQKLIALHLEVADLAVHRLQERERARTELHAVLAQDANHLGALRMVGDLAYQDQRWTEAADAFIKRARLERDPKELKELFLRLGFIYADKEPDAKRAIACFSRVVKAEPTHIVAVQYLSNLFLKEWDYKGALDATRRLVELETDPHKRIEHLHRIAKIHEEGFKDARHAHEALRQALELEPMHLPSIGELARFFDRQSDVQSMRVHLDRTAAKVRGLLNANPFDPVALHSLFKIFTWRRTPDRALMTAGILDHLGIAEPDERAFLNKAHGKDPYPGAILADPGLDESLFDPRIPAGFRHLFRLLNEPLSKLFRADIKQLGIGKQDKLPSRGHAIRDIANKIAADLGIREFDLYVTSAHPTAAMVELTEPLSLVLGSKLVEGAHEHEVRFLLGRLLKMVQVYMAVPMRMSAEDLGVLLAAVVRQFVPDFTPAGFDEKQVAAEAIRVGKAVPKRLHGELAPYAMECASPTLDLRVLAPALIDTANRAGLLTAGLVGPSLTALKRLGDPAQVKALVRFAVSDELADLRRQVGTSIG